MAWFFVDRVCGETHHIIGEDALHIAKSLRMAAGEQLTLCDSTGTEHSCVIESADTKNVCVRVLESKPCKNEPGVNVTLFQALPKNDKMDLIIQKAVELGVHKVVPVVTNRCISRPDKKSAKKKVQRWQKIARQAAQQSRRGIMPQVLPVCSFKEAVQTAEKMDRLIIFYECGGISVGKTVQKTDREIAVFVGSEGGFAPEEVQFVLDNKGTAATLGRRILRAETAPLAALSVLMYITGNFD